MFGPGLALIEGPLRRCTGLPSVYISRTRCSCSQTLCRCHILLKVSSIKAYPPRFRAIIIEATVHYDPRPHMIGIGDWMPMWRLVSYWMTWRGPRWDTRWNGLPRMIVIQSCATTHSALFPDGGPPSWSQQTPFPCYQTPVLYRYAKLTWSSLLLVIIQVCDTHTHNVYFRVLPRLSVLTVTLTVSDHLRESRYQLYCRV